MFSLLHVDVRRRRPGAPRRAGARTARATKLRTIADRSFVNSQLISHLDPTLPRKAPKRNRDAQYPITETHNAITRAQQKQTRHHTTLDRRQRAQRADTHRFSHSHTAGVSLSPYGMHTARHIHVHAHTRDDSARPSRPPADRLAISRLCGQHGPTVMSQQVWCRSA